MLYNIISDIKGCQFAHIVTLTEVKIPKKLGIVGVVTKQYEGEVQLNYSYENAVNNRLEKQGDERTFVADQLRWGTWEIVNKIITHKGAKYLRYYAFKGSNKPKVEYFVDGKSATSEELAIIKAYEQSKYKGSAKQSAEGLTTNQVSPKVVNFDNILELKVGSQSYTKSTLRLVG